MAKGTIRSVARRDNTLGPENVNSFWRVLIPDRGHVFAVVRNNAGHGFDFVDQDRHQPISLPIFRNLCQHFVLDSGIGNDVGDGRRVFCIA